MIKRKFIFTISLICLFLGIFVFKTEVNDSLTAMLAVAQLSDDVMVNSLARSVVRKDFFNWFNSCFIIVGTIGFVFSFVPKKSKEVKEN